MSPSPSTRWCPTPEQLMILEELYRRGVRTPNASNIQKITAHLALYGKIQGKNVFYWFQNHKARDRQKLRKKFAKQLHQQQLLQQHLYHNQTLYFNNPNYYNNPNNNNNNILDFLNPFPFHQFSDIGSCSTDDLLTQGTTDQVYKEVGPPEGVMPNQTWMGDLPKDCLMRSYGHDSIMIKMDDVGPTFPCCSTNRPRPLQTLELFPLRSET